MKYDAVIFDLDGTLLDTLQDLADAMNSVLEARGWPVHPRDAYRRLVGEGARNLVRNALPPGERADGQVLRCLSEYQAEYGRRWNATTRPYDGIPGLLDELTRRGMKMAVLSNKPDAFTRLCTDKLLAKWRFDAVLGQTEGIPLKPDPAGPTRIARELRIDPSRFLYAGDSGVDMRTAVNAGMFPVGVLWGFRDRAELVEGGAKEIISQPLELVKLIG